MTRHEGRAALRRRLADDSGAAMVEFAFIAALLFTLLLGFIDFGRALFLYNNLTNAAREGARAAAVQFPNPCATEDDKTLIRDRVANRIREFNANPAADPAQYVDCVAVGAPPTMVTVTIRNYPFRAITPLPYLQGLTIGSATIPVDATVRFEGSSD